MFRSKRLYELCFRADEGLPLPARPLIGLLIQAALARTQRDDKVALCNYVWMGNHPHISFVSQDVNALKNFYGELKKRLTDMLKRLLGLTHLNIWPKEPTVIEILDLEEAIKRHVYFFCNPAKASLVTSIEEYPGESTWNDFANIEASLDAKVEIEVPWIRLPSIPALSSPNPSRAEEERIIRELTFNNKEKEKLTFYPFAWLKVFGITSSRQVNEIRNRIVEMTKETEQGLLKERFKDRMQVLGVARLLRASISVRGHKPKKIERKIFFLSSISELRCRFLAHYKRFCDDCRQCYRLACKGVKDLIWPHGAFVPPIPALANPL